MARDRSIEPFSKPAFIPSERRKAELLTVLYWFTAGLPAKVPPEVSAHPLWPANNDIFHKDSTKGHLATACPGRDRLWEAIEQEFGLDLRGKIK